MRLEKTEKDWSNSKSAYQVFIELPYQTNAYQIMSDEKFFVDYCKNFYGSHVCSEYQMDLKRNLVIIVIRKSFSGYEVNIDNVVETVEEPIKLLHNYIYKNTNYSNEYIALHGAVVVCNGKANVLLAPKYTGKTTMAVYLDQCGKEVVSDDCALINVNTMSVLAIDVPFHLREGGLNVLRDGLGLTFEAKPVSADNMDVRYIYEPRCHTKRNISVGQFLFLNRCDKPISVLTRLCQREIFNRLLKAVLIPYKLTQEYICSISKLSQINAYEVNYVDLDFVKGIIENL